MPSARWLGELRVVLDGAASDGPGLAPAWAAPGEATVFARMIGDLLSRIREIGRGEHWPIGEGDVWSPRHFTELEAEVESQGPWAESRIPLRRGGILAGENLRREKSLTVALARSTAPLVRLEGEPGSGKSMALRALAHNAYVLILARHQVPTRVPLYINLRDIKRDGREIDQALIYDYVETTFLSHVGPDLADKARSTFRTRWREGGWRFLFDSFDEIPDVLGATDVSGIVELYSEAIQRFTLRYDCRSVVASREYKGPRIRNIPRFRILRLSEARQLTLLSRYATPVQAGRRLIPGREPSRGEARQLIERIATAPPELRALTDNPMFLVMLFFYLRKHGTFPDSLHQVFADYLSSLIRWQSRPAANTVKRSAAEIERGAAKLAFCISADDDLGLSPAPARLAAAYTARGLGPESKALAIMHELEEARVARRMSTATSFGAGQFAFSRRRFQEYFTTRYVLANPDSVSPDLLLRDGRWRETAVTVLQLRGSVLVTKLLAGIEQRLSDAVGRLPRSLFKLASVDRIGFGSARTVRPVPWPEGVLHLLGIVSAAQLPPEVRPARLDALAAEILVPSAINGTVLDRKWSMEVSAGSCSPEVARWFVREGLRGGSAILRDVAVTQITRAGAYDKASVLAVRRTAATIAAERRLRGQWYGLRAQLRRMDDAYGITSFLYILRFTPWPLAAVALALVIAGRAASGQPVGGQFLAGESLAGAVLAFAFGPMRSSPPFSWWPNRSPWSTWMAGLPAWMTVSVGWCLYVVAGAVFFLPAFDRPAATDSPTRVALGFCAAAGYIVLWMPAVHLFFALRDKARLFNIILPWVDRLPQLVLTVAQLALTLGVASALFGAALAAVLVALILATSLLTGASREAVIHHGTPIVKWSFEPRRHARTSHRSAAVAATAGPPRARAIRDPPLRESAADSDRLRTTAHPRNRQARQTRHQLQKRWARGGLRHPHGGPSPGHPAGETPWAGAPPGSCRA